MFDIALIIAVIVGLIELVKKLEAVPVKYMPLFSLLFGIIAGVLYIEGSFKEQLMYGIMIGLSASGLFDQSKIITKKSE